MRRYHTYMAIPYNYNYTVCSRMRDGRNNQPNECKNELTMKSCLAENHFDALAIACCFFFFLLWPIQWNLYTYSVEWTKNNRPTTKRKKKFRNYLSSKKQKITPANPKLRSATKKKEERNWASWQRHLQSKDTETIFAIVFCLLSHFRA